MGAGLRASGASAVIHFEGYKSVGESVQKPRAYYHNVAGSLNVLQTP